MAVTVTNVGLRHSAGDEFASVSTLAFDASYLSGGEGVTKIQLGCWPGASVSRAFVEPFAGYNGQYDATLELIHLFRTDQVDDPEEEVPSTTDVSAVTAMRITVYWK